MSKSKSKKFYTVWIGRQPGVYDSWEECQAQTAGYPGAKFKSFNTLAAAETAFKHESIEYIGKDTFDSALSPDERILIGDPKLDSISVDAAWNTVTGEIEYRGVDTKTKKQLFHHEPLADGTINLAEFLAIVHGLGYCKKNNLTCPVYSDSRNAILWVKSREVRTKHPRSDRNKPLYDLVDRALNWIKTNSYPNDLLKWETRAWGENPADFGRK